MGTRLWGNTDDTHENRGMIFVEDCWRSLSNPKYLMGVLQRVELSPGNDYVTLEWVERMLLLKEGRRFFFSQGGAALCLFHATPFDQWPNFQLPEDFVGGAPYPIDKDDAASTFATFFCWMMTKADPQIKLDGILRYPEPYRQWASAYLGVRLWVYGWVNKEVFIWWAWERGLLASTCLRKWERWEKLDLEKSGVLSLGNE